LRLTVLGSGTGWPRLDRNAPGYLLQSEVNLLLDMGPSIIKQLLKRGVTLEEIDAIFISHFHPDHVSDLIPFLFATRYQMGYKRKRPVKIYGCEGIKEFLSLLSQAFDGTIDPPEGLIEIMELPKIKNYVFPLGDFEAITTPVKHREESLAIRLEKEGKALVYSGDTGYCDEIVELAEGADLLILECSNPVIGEPAHHLAPEEVALIAKRAKVKTLLVSHFYPHSEGIEVLEKIKREFEGRCLLAEDLLSIEI